MNKNFDYIDFSLNVLPEFCKYITSTAKLSGLTSRQALMLLIIAECKKNLEFYMTGQEEVISQLVSLDCITNDETTSLTAKGSIIAKALLGAKEKFNQKLMAQF